MHPAQEPSNPLRKLPQRVIYRHPGVSEPYMLPVTESVNPNMQKDYDKLEGVSKWDGIPFNDFTRVWVRTLRVALGSIAQDGWTLVQTAWCPDLNSY